jgi:hypothetical protein
MNNTMSQQSSTQVFTPNPVYTALSEREWENFAAMELRAEIDRMDAIAAATSGAKVEDQFTEIDGLRYRKAWVVSDEAADKKDKTTFESRRE